MIKIIEALTQINNTAVRKELRRYHPQWCTIVIDLSGVIINIIKHKEEPNLALNRSHYEKYPNTYQITAWQGRFTTEDELRKAVQDATDLGRKY